MQKDPLQKNPNGSKKNRFLRESWLFLSDILYNAVIIILLVVVIRSFIISPFRVVGSSMADTLENNEFILIDKLSYIIGEPDRGDPIVFLPPIINRYPHKFEEKVTVDETGVATLDIGTMKTLKTLPYCKKNPLRLLWICKEEVYEGDLVYFRPTQEDERTGGSDSSWINAEKRKITEDEVEKGSLKISGLPNTSYWVRVYNFFGGDYFVKRIIGIPGDTIKIENGRVYLKENGQEEFREITEAYLNPENANRTYFPNKLEEDTFTVPEGHYFVLGDNRNHSNDSRSWFTPLDQVYSPYVSESQISGKVGVVLWPLTRLRIIGGADL